MSPRGPTGIDRHLERFVERHPNNAAIRTFLSRASAQIIHVTQADGIRQAPWRLTIRLPRELEAEFGFSRELLMFASGWNDFRVGDLDAIRQVVNKTDRVEPEAALLVCDDPRVADKVFEWSGNAFTLFAFTHKELQAVLTTREAAVGAFRSALQGALFGRNFYAESGPVTGERFFGRSTLLSKIRSDFNNHRPVGLFGLRKIGKTSVVQQALRSLREHEYGAYIDLAGERIHRDARHTLVTLVERLSKVSAFSFPAVRWADSPDRFTTAVLEALEANLANLQANGQKLVLALDEIEALFPTSETDGLLYWEELLGALRSLWQGYSSFELVFVGVNPSVFERPSVGDRDNPVFAFVSPTYVQCMSDREFARMVTDIGKRTGVRWPTEVLRELYESTGGHPFLSRQVCAEIVVGLEPPATVDLPLLAERLDSVVLTRQDIFNEIFDSLRRHFPHELETLERVAVAGALPVRDVQRDELGHLIGYELVEIQSNVVRQRVGLLARWLRER